MALRPRVSIPVLLALSALTLAGAERPPGGMKAGVVITAEGGIEGTQVYKYDADGRPLDGTPAKARTGGATRPAGTAPLSAAPGATSAPAAAAPAPKQAIKTADGRTVPFSVEGKGIGKSVDDAVDFNAGLKKASKSSGLMEQRFEAGMSSIGKEQVYSRNNLITLVCALHDINLHVDNDECCLTAFALINSHDVSVDCHYESQQQEGTSYWCR